MDFCQEILSALTTLEIDEDFVKNLHTVKYLIFRTKVIIKSFPNRE